MEISKSEKTHVEFNDSVSAGSYVSSWSGKVEFTFESKDSSGVSHEFKIQLPLDSVRAFCERLAEDIVEYDELQAKRKAEQEKESAEV